MRIPIPQGTTKPSTSRTISVTGTTISVPCDINGPRVTVQIGMATEIDLG